MDTSIKPLTLAAVAEHLGLANTNLPHITLCGIASVHQADTHEITYCTKNFAQSLATTKAAAVITTAELASLAPCPTLIVANPRLAWAQASMLFTPPPPAAGIHPTAQVASNANIHPSVSIGPGAVIEPEVVLAEDVVVGAGCFLGSGVRIHARSRLMPRVSCYSGIHIGEGCLIHAGAVIGSDGFGFEADNEGRWHKIAQIGGVIIGNDVEIGANTAIDSGSLSPTRIGNGVKLDNLVHIGHGSIIEDNCLLCSGALLGGSVVMGKGCILAGNNAIKFGVHLAPGTILGASTTLTTSTQEGGMYLSLFPAKKRKDWLQLLRTIARSNANRSR